MALNIPLPSADFGGGLVKTSQNLLNQLMQKNLKDQEREQAERHFQEQLKLSKAAAARAGANSDLQRMIMQQQLLKMQHSNDPMYEFNQFKNLMGAMSGAGETEGQAGNQMPMPTQEMGEGMGMFSPEGLQDNQAQMSQMAGQQGQPSANNPMLDALRKNPLLRGFFKQKFGYDPLAMPQTPEEKQAGALNLFQQKEEIKKQNKGGAIPTNTVLTLNQNAIQGIDTVLPMLDELIKSEEIPGILTFSPGKKAAYNARTSGMIDTLIAAQSLPKVQASIDLVEEQVRRKTGETVEDYKKRLKDLKNDLLKRRERSRSLLSQRQVNINPVDDYSHMTDDELRAIAGGG